MSEPHKGAFELIALRTRSEYQQVQHSTELLSVEIEHNDNSKFQESQAASAKRLTLLAAVFLPLSLAAGMLGMNSRATNLGIIWYDFFALCSLLSVVAFFSYKMIVIVQFVSQLKFLGNMFASVDINDTAKRCLRERGLPTQTLGRTVYWTKAYFYSAWLVIVVSSVVGLSQQLPPWIFYVVGSCFLIICIPMWFMLIVRERLGIVSCAQNISEGAAS